jgi:hypothetical protein
MDRHAGPATAAGALQAGEIDWWEQALPDLVPTLMRRPRHHVQRQDPYGFIAHARFNHLQAPFNNVKLRRAVLSALRQEDLHAVDRRQRRRFHGGCAGPCSPAACRMCRGRGADMPQPTNLDAACARR